MQTHFEAVQVLKDIDPKAHLIILVAESGV